jgi:hypothetical protein
MDRSRIVFNAAAACTTALLMACSDESGSPFGPEETDVPLEPAAGVREDPPAGKNGMLPACFWAHSTQGVLRTLGGAALNQGANSLPSILLDQIDVPCRHVLAYTVKCALQQGDSILDPVTGELYGGRWGLATGWKNAALNASGRRYVTACLVQTLNATGTAFPLALEGPHAAIAHSAVVDATFSLEENTAVGDLFSSTTLLDGLLPAFKVYACTEDLLPLGCNALGLPLLGNRICDGALLCGFVSLGPCALSLSCAANGEYWKCKPNALGLGSYWTETVRARIDPDDCD